MSAEAPRSYFQSFKATGQSIVRAAVQPGILEGVGLAAMLISSLEVLRDPPLHANIEATNRVPQVAAGDIKRSQDIMITFHNQVDTQADQVVSGQGIVDIRELTDLEKIKQAQAVLALAKERVAQRDALIPQLTKEESQKPLTQAASYNFVAGIGLFLIGLVRQQPRIRRRETKTTM